MQIPNKYMKKGKSEVLNINKGIFIQRLIHNFLFTCGIKVAVFYFSEGRRQYTRCPKLHLKISWRGREY